MDHPIVSALARRAVLGGALALPAVLSGTSGARAAAPLQPRQAPGFNRFRLGEAEVTVVHDGFASRNALAGNFIRNAEADAVRASLERSLLDPEALPTHYNITFLNTGRQLILFDTGTGGLLADTAGAMWANMEAAGIRAEDVDVIVFTHFHGDHVSGLVDREGKARFPRAQLLVPRAEWSFWTGDRAPAQAASMVKNRFAPYEGRINQIASDGEVTAGITAIPTPGHTPGHTSYGLQSGNDTVLVLGDVTNHPAVNLRNPGWHVSFDMDAGLAEATRRRFFDRAASDRTPIIGYHWPFPAVARVRKDGEGYEAVPVTWSGRV